MVGHANRRIVFSVLLVVAFALTGCGKGTSKSPPKQQVQDAVTVVLPPFLSLDSVELEPISTGPESAKVNFKAIVASKEDLCQVDRDVEGTPKITLLKVVQAAGTKVSLYGCVEARRTMDLWTLDPPQIQTGLEQLGKPRGAFNAQAYVIGSSEAIAALKQQAANAEIERQAKEAAARQQEIERAAQEERQVREDKAQKERQEQARIALEEQRRKNAEQQKKEEEQRKEEEEAALQKVKLATAPGTRYAGTLSDEKSRQRMLLKFTEQDGFLIRAEASNPDAAIQKRTLTGEIISNSKQPSDTGKTHQIRLSPADGGYNATKDIMHKEIIGLTHLDHFYFDENQAWTIDLDLTDTGLEGETSGGLTIRLQPGTAATVKSPKNTTKARPAPKNRR